VVLEKLKAKSQNEIFISSITVAELEFGVKKSQHQIQNRFSLIRFLSLFQILHYDENDALEYGSIRHELEKAGKIIGAMDLLLASQAVAKKLIMVTNNVKEFERIPRIIIENWVK